MRSAGLVPCGKTKMFKQYSDIFKPGSGAVNFFVSLLVWGVAAGCFTAILNNYLSEIRQIDEYERGVLEFFREMPGLLLVFIIAVLHRQTDWAVLRLGTLIAMAGVAGLMVSADKWLITGLIMLWSTGEHMFMPVRSSIAIRVAKEGRLGHSLGLVTGALNVGQVTGSLLAAVIFLVASRKFHVDRQDIHLYNMVWGGILALLVLSLIVLYAKGATGDGEAERVNRPRLYFSRRYNRFYALELFYGARKQIFLTFAPYVLVRFYGMETATMAILVCVCALLNIFCAPWIGRLTDRIGYKNVMIYDTVVLFFVCIVYGYADRLFPRPVAYWIVCLNYVLDAIISTTSMATNLYVKEIAASQDELTSTLTTGISINHLISILAALLGGFVWRQYGFGVLFTFSAIMALANSAFAMTLPRPGRTVGS